MSLDPHARPPLRLARFLVLGCMLVWTAWATAAINVTLVLSDSGAMYRAAADSLQHELAQENQHWQVQVQTLATRIGSTRENLVIPLGLRALQKVLAEPGSTPVWALLVPRAEFDLIAAKHAAAKRRPLSALYLDQPMPRQIQMLMAALPATKRLGVLVGSSDTRVAEAIREASSAHALEVSSERISRADDAVALLDDLKGRIDILLLVPDPQVLSSSMLQPLLLETYRLRLPVVAYSTQLIEAGAMLALYTSPGRLGQEAGQRLRHARRNGSVKLPPTAYPDSFDVAVNRSVALSLGIRVPTGELIRQRMDRKSGR